jgi:DNA invertase Pin-like site-specific DNA recombinase
MSRDGARVAVAYVRTPSLSDDDASASASLGNAANANGAGAQRAAIEAWAVRRRIEVASWRVDRGVTGETPIAERPGLVAAYADVRRLGAGLLVAATAECFTHDALVAWLIERAALTEGAAIHTVDGSSPATSDSTWTRGAVDLARAYERVVLRSRTRAALAAKKSRGERVGALPYGFRLAADGVHLEADAAEHSVMASVRQLAGEGLSQRALVACLAARGVSGRTGAPLGQTQVARMLLRSAS